MSVFKMLLVVFFVVLSVHSLSIGDDQDTDNEIDADIYELENQRQNGQDFDFKKYDNRADDLYYADIKNTKFRNRAKAHSFIFAGPKVGRDVNSNSILSPSDEENSSRKSIDASQENGLRQDKPNGAFLFRAHKPGDQTKRHF